MGKTGGGRGTNQHKIRGVSTARGPQQRPEPEVNLNLPAGQLDRAGIWGLVTSLAERLVDNGVEANVYLIGGAAAAMRYYPDGIERRLTDDIDAAFSPVPEVQAQIEAIAAERGLRSEWFNNKAQGFLPPSGRPEGEVLYERDGVKVMIAPARVVLAMKLRAARLGRDDEDIAVLLRHCGIRSMAEADALVYETYDGEEEIPPARRKVVESAFGAYELTRSSPPLVLPPIL